MHHQTYDILDIQLRQSMQECQYPRLEEARFAPWGTRIALWLIVFSLLVSYCLPGVQADEFRTIDSDAQSLESRNLLFDRITIDDGLSQGTVNTITQDHKGFIWFGTQEGLNRYDGQTIVVYEHDYTDRTSLS